MSLHPLRYIRPILVLVLVLFLGVSSYGEEKRHPIPFEDGRLQLPTNQSVHNRVKALDIDSVVNQGVEYLRRHQYDTAMLYFSEATNRYRPDLSREDKKHCLAALNNCGLIYYNSRHEYKNAYICFASALEICKKQQILEKEKYAYCNIGEMLGFYAQVFGSETILQRSDSFSLRAIDSSIDQGYWQIFTDSYICMMSRAALNDRLDQYAHIIQQMDTLQIDTDYICRDHIIYFMNAIQAFAQHDYALARVYMSKQRKSIVVTHYVYNNYAQWVSLMAQSFICEQRYDSAVHYLNELNQISQRHQIEDCHEAATRKLSYCYQQMGDLANSQRFLAENIRVKDSILSVHHLNDVGELYFLQSLHEVDEQLASLTGQKQLRDWQLVVSILAIVTVILFLIYIYQKNRKLQARHRQLYQLSLERVKAQPQPPSLTTPRRQSITINQDSREALLEKIHQVINDPDTICAVDFNIDTLATLVDSKARYVSEAINEHYGKSFSILLSDQRVLIACRNMHDKVHFGNLTVDAISQTVGMKSRTTFNTAFKRVTGLTPSEYLRQMSKG